MARLTVEPIPFQRSTRINYRFRPKADGSDHPLPVGSSMYFRCESGVKSTLYALRKCILGKKYFWIRIFSWNPRSVNILSRRNSRGNGMVELKQLL